MESQLAGDQPEPNSDHLPSLDLTIPDDTAPYQLPKEISIPAGHDPEHPSREFLAQLASNIDEQWDPFHPQPIPRGRPQPDIHLPVDLNLDGKLDGEYMDDLHPYPRLVPRLGVRATLPNLPFAFPPASEILHNADDDNISGVSQGYGSTGDVTSLLKQGIEKYSRNDFEGAKELFAKSVQNDGLGAEWLLKNQRLLDLQRQATSLAYQYHIREAALVVVAIDDQRTAELGSLWGQEWVKQSEEQRLETAESSRRAFVDGIEPWERSLVLEDNVFRDVDLLLNTDDAYKRTIITSRIRERYFKHVPPPGYSLHGGWETGRLVGRGSAGIVVQARHRSDVTGKLVACKLLTLRQSKEEAIKGEVMALQKAAGKHVIEIIGHGPLRSWWYAIYMPLADCDLKSYLDSKKALTLKTHRDREAVGDMRRTLFSCICCLSDTLAILHQGGIYHRDIKPGNILFFGCRPVFTDFSLASSTGTILGSSGDPRYASPEMGSSGARADAGDVFALGGVFFEMLEALSALVLSEDAVFPTVEGTFAASIRSSSFKDQASRVQEVHRLDVYNQVPGLTESLLNIVVSNMLTRPDRRKNAETVSMLIKRAMVQTNFQDECCTSKQRVQRGLFIDSLVEFAGNECLRLQEHIERKKLTGEPIEDSRQSASDQALRDVLADWM
ncbi:kinase-like domain-containing protein [Hypoxylon sp. FL1857]|nr:kinase-like domain-containing protein [Hypoxylon sp. FL1857]